MEYEDLKALFICTLYVLKKKLELLYCIVIPIVRHG